MAAFFGFNAGNNTGGQSYAPGLSEFERGPTSSRSSGTNSADRNSPPRYQYPSPSTNHGPSWPYFNLPRPSSSRGSNGRSDSTSSMSSSLYSAASNRAASAIDYAPYAVGAKELDDGEMEGLTESDIFNARAWLDQHRRDRQSRNVVRNAVPEPATPENLNMRPVTEKEMATSNVRTKGAGKLFEMQVQELDKEANATPKKKKKKKKTKGSKQNNKQQPQEPLEASLDEATIKALEYEGGMKDDYANLLKKEAQRMFRDDPDKCQAIQDDIEKEKTSPPARSDDRPKVVKKDGTVVADSRPPQRQNGPRTYPGGVPSPGVQERRRKDMKKKYQALAGKEAAAAAKRKQTGSTGSADAVVEGNATENAAGVVTAPRRSKRRKPPPKS